MNAVQQYYNNENYNRKVNNYYKLSQKYITPIPRVDPRKFRKPHDPSVFMTSPLSRTYRQPENTGQDVHPHNENENEINALIRKIMKKARGQGGGSVTRRMQKQKRKQKQRKTRGYRRRV